MIQPTYSECTLRGNFNIIIQESYLEVRKKNGCQVHIKVYHDLGGGKGQGGLASCSPWGRKEWDTTEWLNNNKWPGRTDLTWPPLGPWVGDAIQPSHPLSSPSPPAPSPSQHQGLFKWVNSLHEVAKVLEFQLQYQSFQWTPRTDLLQDGLVGSPCSPRDSQDSSPTPQFKSINFFGTQLYSQSNSHIHTWQLEKT